MQSRRADVVSVVVLDDGDLTATQTTVSAIEACDWPPESREVIVVALQERIAALVAALGTKVRVVPTGEPNTHPLNAGIARCRGEFLALLDAGSRPHPQWVRNAVKALHGGLEIGAIASRVIKEEGSAEAPGVSTLTWFSAGYRAANVQDQDKPRDVLYGERNGLFLRTPAFVEAGGFDPLLNGAYDDVDLGWRLNLYGYRVLYCPEAIVDAPRQPCDLPKQHLVERNALVCLFKNLDGSNVGKFLTGALGLATRRAVSASGLDASGDVADRAHRQVSADALASLLGADQFVGLLETLTPQRRKVQQRRVVRDEALFSLVGALPYGFGEERVDSTIRSVADALDIPASYARLRVLVVTGDVIGAKMAGPAIRAWNMCEQLSLRNEVRLVSTARPTRASTRFDVVHVADDRAMAEHESWADVIVIQGYTMRQFGTLARTQKILVADIYDPLHLEQLEQSRETRFEGWNNQVIHASEVLNEQIARADFLLCASEKQRDFWLGQLAAVGRVNAMTYDSDNALRKLIDVAPFGLDPVVPEQQRHAIKGTVPGIGAEDKVLIWGGGIYDWFDTETLLHAMARVSETHPDARLFFLGAAHPNPGVPMMRAQARTLDLADELHLTNRVVFFNHEWVAFDERHNYLLDADAAVSTHFEHIETAFSFRTRILDYLWAHLPIVATRGDGFAEMIETSPLGVTVPERDVPALADAIIRVLYDEDFRAQTIAQLASAREQFAWSHALEPLTSFCAAPRAAPDRDRLSHGRVLRMPDPAADAIRGQYHGARKYARLGRLYLRREGVSGFIRRARFRLGL